MRDAQMLALLGYIALFAFIGSWAVHRHWIRSFDDALRSGDTKKLAALERRLFGADWVVQP